MERNTIIPLKNTFDRIVHTSEVDNIEFWYARELQELLGYARWENFETAIKRAMISCETTEIKTSDHFREVAKMVELGSGAKRKLLIICLQDTHVT